MAVSGTSRRWGAAPVAVLLARGLGSGPGQARLLADPAVIEVASPRHADALVVAGPVPAAMVEAVQAVHDQLPPPRHVVAVDVEGPLDALGLGPVAPLADDDPAGSLRAALDGPGSDPVGRATSPVDWQGTGDHGQGGEGMMGGMPYGRMMPMPPVEGRDGLALDRLSLTLGPLLPGLPPGLGWEIGLQGDVLEEVALRRLDPDEPWIGAPVPDPRGAAERAAADRLGATASLARIAGLPALSERALALAASPPDPGGIAALRRRLDRPWGLRAATDGVGRLTLDGLDVTGRWRRWLDEATAAADGAVVAASAPVDVETLATELTGMELGQAYLTLCSLQLELAPAATPATSADAP